MHIDIRLRVPTVHHLLMPVALASRVREEVVAIVRGLERVASRVLNQTVAARRTLEVVARRGPHAVVHLVVMLVDAAIDRSLVEVGGVGGGLLRLGSCWREELVVLMSRLVLVSACCHLVLADSRASLVLLLSGHSCLILRGSCRLIGGA